MNIRKVDKIILKNNKDLFMDLIKNAYVLLPDDLNPSLADLENEVFNNISKFSDINIAVIEAYLCECQSKYTQGRYLLYGEIPISKDIPITEDLMIKAYSYKQLNYPERTQSEEVLMEARKIVKNYKLNKKSGLYNEIWGVEKQDSFFSNLIKIIKRYSDFIIEKKYAPETGTEYLDAKERWYENNL